MTDLRNVAIIGLMGRLNMLVDEAEVAISPTDVKQWIADGSIFDRLRALYGDFPEFSAVHEAEALLMRKEWKKESIMAKSSKLDAFSTHRLGGELVPEDVKILLAHADELAERTGIELSWQEDWAPWSDTSYLSAADRANLDIMANVRAIADVCGLIAFIAAHEDDEYFGYWRGPGRRRVADSPLVHLDNEGQFSFCGGSTFAEAVLSQTWGDEQFTELRDWLRSLGIAIQAETLDDLAYPEGDSSPDELHTELYYRYRREAGLS